MGWTVRLKIYTCFQCMNFYCPGMSLPMCSPKLGYSLSQTMADHYPERLGLVICLHHSAIFHGVWKAISVFLHPNTLAKVHLLRSKRKYHEAFQKYFSEEMVTWLMDEISLNKQSPLSGSQRRFWEKPESDTQHDPRGCPSYVSQYIDSYITRAQQSKDREYFHKPHPSVVDAIQGKIKNVQSGSPIPVCESTASAETHGGDSFSDSGEEEATIAEEYQIPKNSSLLNM